MILKEKIVKSKSSENNRGAFTSDIVAGKNTYVYDAHTYHTKVPPEGIKELIRHYTKEGEVVFDPFCGSGMTGIAAVELNRQAILSDLSPAAVFIATNLTMPIDADRYMAEINKIVEHFTEEEFNLYKTSCRTCGKYNPVNYTVWSYDVSCNCCGEIFSLYDAAKSIKPSVKESKIRPEFPCPKCGEVLKKRNLKRQTIKPIMLGYKCSTKSCRQGNKDINVSLTEEDFTLLQNIADTGVPEGLWYPKDNFPNGVNTSQPINAGITSVDKAYTPRAIRAMSQLWNHAMNIEDEEVKQKVLFTITSLYQRVTVFSEFRFWGGSGNIANYSVPSVMNEQNVFKTFLRKAKTIEAYFKSAPKIERNVKVTVQSACNLSHLEDNSIDYIFTDPPFGSNINYSEMNFLWESWLQNKTVIKDEAIVNKVQDKTLASYQDLLSQAFSECKRVLKADGWITVVFHNSSDKVWAVLQNSLKEAGLKIINAQTFDKKHGTFKQYVSDNAVGYDIMLHCKKEKNKVGKTIKFNIPQTEKQILKFITAELNNQDLSYSVKYLHVKRDEEVDYRRLYAKWLTSSLSSSVINLGFDEFRSLVDKVILKKK
ncbi:DNA methyltransferase [Flavobacterium sp. LB1P71]|uniref:DNA methyltransferase n=1 Tax=Flavobacterium sp. LB1P71 TaxID=3401716 RepID=UPI003AAD675A